MFVLVSADFDWTGFEEVVVYQYRYPEEQIFTIYTMIESSKT